MSCRSADEVAGAVCAAVPGVTSVVPEWRWWRWVVPLPGDHLAFVADDSEGWLRLRREALLLGRLAGVGGLAVPVVVATAEVGWVQVRRKVGVTGVSGFVVENLIFDCERKVSSVERYRPDCTLSARGERLAADLGRALAALQGAVTPDEARVWGFGGTDYLHVLDQVAVRLAGFPALADLRAAVAPLRAWFEALPADPVVALRDLQVHNLSVDAESGRLLGLFDLDDAAVAHRLEDFKYLPSLGRRFLGIALDGYARAGGPRLAVADLWQFHVLSALEHVLFVREDTARWVEIVDWARRAIAAQ